MSELENSMPFPADPTQVRRLPKAVARFLRRRRRHTDPDRVPEYLLKDVGLTRMDFEYAKPRYRFF